MVIGNALAWEQLECNKTKKQKNLRREDRVCVGELINVSMVSVHERLLGRGLTHFTHTNSNDVTKGNKNLN